MRYDITLTIAHAYQSPAGNARQIVHLMPADRRGRQRLISGNLSIEPTPSWREDRFDFFGNAQTAIAFTKALSEVEIRLQARVEVIGDAEPKAKATSIKDIAGELVTTRNLGPSSPVHFLAASSWVPVDYDIAAYAENATAGLDDTAQMVEALGKALHRDMRFDPHATTVDTPAGEAFSQRHGVCQDFTHIMISGLRSLGIPASYVSGFLRTTPPPGQPRLEGADAMHAWVGAWCGTEAGWVEYDPTNATFARGDHVVVGYGRDYGDIAPVRGTMRTTGAQESSHAVDMIPFGE